MSSLSVPSPLADTEQLKRDLWRRAAELAANSDPRSLSAAAATQILTCLADYSAKPTHGIAEDAEAVSGLASDLRKIILASPFDAPTGVHAFDSVVDIYGQIRDPRSWRPSAEQKARAQKVLGENPQDIRFTRDGAMIARVRGGSFVDIDPEPEVSR